MSPSITSFFSSFLPTVYADTQGPSEGTVSKVEEEEASAVEESKAEEAASEEEEEEPEDTEKMLIRSLTDSPSNGIDERGDWKWWFQERLQSAVHKD
ncbi:hypothetical protein F5887DRAFT_1085345 [Amanita rubescens]|nr:hypothetical protein F5887DRAFT_1085345 [Amanita rubescens]